MRTIEVPNEVADALEARARRAGLPLADVLRLLAADEGDDAPIRTDPEVMGGGDDRVRNTRIPVWLLVSARQQGQTDAEILESYPELRTLDLAAAWDHFARDPERVARQRARHDKTD